MSDRTRRLMREAILARQQHDNRKFIVGYILWYGLIAIGIGLILLLGGLTTMMLNDGSLLDGTYIGEGLD